MKEKTFCDTVYKQEKKALARRSLCESLRNVT